MYFRIPDQLQEIYMVGVYTALGGSPTAADQSIQVQHQILDKNQNKEIMLINPDGTIRNVMVHELIPLSTNGTVAGTKIQYFINQSNEKTGKDQARRIVFLQKPTDEHQQEGVQNKVLEVCNTIGLEPARFDPKVLGFADGEMMVPTLNQKLLALGRRITVFDETPENYEQQIEKPVSSKMEMPITELFSEIVVSPIENLRSIDEALSVIDSVDEAPSKTEVSDDGARSETPDVERERSPEIEVVVNEPTPEIKVQMYGTRSKIKKEVIEVLSVTNEEPVHKTTNEVSIHKVSPVIEKKIYEASPKAPPALFSTNEKARSGAVPYKRNNNVYTEHEVMVPDHAVPLDIEISVLKPSQKTNVPSSRISTKNVDPPPRKNSAKILRSANEYQNKIASKPENTRRSLPGRKNTEKCYPPKAFKVQRSKRMLRSGSFGVSRSKTSEQSREINIALKPGSSGWLWTNLKAGDNESIKNPMRNYKIPKLSKKDNVSQPEKSFDNVLYLPNEEEVKRKTAPTQTIRSLAQSDGINGRFSRMNMVPETKREIAQVSMKKFMVYPPTNEPGS